MQVGVNYANDYSDGVRGTDEVRVGPVRLVAGKLASPGAVKRAALASFAVGGAAGLVLAAVTTWWLVPIGVAAVAAGWFYTGGPKPYGYAGLGEAFVFVFFGLVATVGTAYVQSEEVTALSFVAGAAMGALACALLVVNNLRDIPTDGPAGKRTLAVRLGDQRTRVLYVALLAAGFGLAALCGVWRWPAVLVLAASPVALAPVRAVRSGATGRDLIAVLGGTARVQLVVGLVLSGLLAVGA
jgi:1,4-dihydroxy-2-naphthoate octaprenyltransferase